MTVVDIQMVRRIAELSRLFLSPTEEQDAQLYLNRILASFQALRDIPMPESTSQNADERSAWVCETAQDKDESLSRLRADTVDNAVNTTEFLSQTPEREGRFLKVPAILTQQT